MFRNLRFFVSLYLKQHKIDNKKKANISQGEISRSDYSSVQNLSGKMDAIQRHGHYQHDGSSMYNISISITKQNYNEGPWNDQYPINFLK